MKGRQRGDSKGNQEAIGGGRTASSNGDEWTKEGGSLTQLADTLAAVEVGNCDGDNVFGLGELMV